MNNTTTKNKASDIKLPATILLVAQTNGGKTYYAKNTLLPALKGQYDVLVICSPTLNVNGDFDYIKADDKTVFKIQDNITDAVSELITSQTKMFDMKRQDLIKEHQIPRVLVILDDCLGLKLFEGEKSIMSKFSIKARHYKMSFIIMSQRLNGVPRQLRLNSKYIITFSVAGYSELERLMVEYFSKKYHKKFQEKMVEIFSVPYNHLFIDNQERNVTKRIYVNGTKLIDWGDLDDEKKDVSEDVQKQKN